MHQLNQHAEERKDLISHDPFNKKEVDNSPPRQKQTISSTNTTTEAAISSKSLFLVGVFTIIWYNTSSKNAIATQQLVEYYNNYIAEQSSTGSEGTGSIMVETGIFLSHHVLHFCMMTSLTTMQLIVGLGIATLLSSRHSALGFFSPSNNSNESSSSSSRIEDISPERKFYSRLIGTLHYLGSFFTNMGFAYGSASIVQVIKLLEPIETLLLSFIVHQLIVKYKKGKSTENATGPNIGIVKVISVFIIVTGTSLLLTSKGIKKNVNAYTVIFALLSGFALSSRNVAQKTATRKEKNVIATMIVESSSMTNKNHKTAGSELREAAALGLQNFISITSYAIIPALIFLLFVELHGVEGIDGSVVIWILTSTGDFGLQAILFHGLYNIASISVLGLVSAPTHSLLNVGKRISNVLVAAVFFSEPLGTHGAFGLSMAAVGGCIYSKSNY